MAFCPTCGKAYEGIPSFCPNCGSALVASAITASKNPQSLPPARPVRQSHAARNAAIVILLIGIFFFLPVVPYTFSSGSLFGLASYEVSAQVSPSYALMHCGYVFNPHATGSVLGYQVGNYQGESKFVC